MRNPGERPLQVDVLGRQDAEPLLSAHVTPELSEQLEMELQEGRTKRRRDAGPGTGLHELPDDIEHPPAGNHRLRRRPVQEQQALVNQRGNRGDDVETRSTQCSRSVEAQPTGEQSRHPKHERLLGAQ